MVTKDADFRNSHLLTGSPARLLVVATGNIRNDDLSSIRVRLAEIEDAFGLADHVEEVGAVAAQGSSIRTPTASEARRALMPSRVSQGAVVDRDGLGHLKESDQFESVQALRAGLVLVDLWPPGVDGWVALDAAVNVGEPENLGTPCIIVHRVCV